MVSFNKDRINSSFFVFGFIKAASPPGLEERIELLGVPVRKYHFKDYGYFFFTTPFYVDVSENKDMVWIKIGHAHDGEKLLSTDDLLDKGWLNLEGVKYDKFQGSVTLLGFNKHHFKCLISGNILSASNINYYHKGDVFIVSDNLRLMANLLRSPRLNDDILPQHFLYRAVYGRSTYIKDVYKLTSGDLLILDEGDLLVKLGRDIRSIHNESTMLPINEETINLFFEQLRAIVRIYLNKTHGKSSTMLSGGVDSTLIQAAINKEISSNTDYSTISYYLETKAFEFEIEYAKRAAHALNTNHSFVKITPELYRDFLIGTTEVLGHPTPDDVRPCFLMLANNLPRDVSHINHFFHGIDAETFGVQKSMEVIQADKYRSWPISVLRLFGGILKPFSQSKSYGARTAAEILDKSRFPDSPDHFLNSEGMYTDLSTVTKCFSENDITRAFMNNQSLESEYHGSDLLVEKLNTIDLLTDGMNTTGIMSQLGYYSGISYIFPYADEMILKSAYLYDPLVRYTYGHRAKPVLKTALEMQVPELDVNQSKGWSGIGQAHLFEWMKDGVLSDMVHAIERPGFLDQKDFEQLLENPNWFTWSMLTLDLFQKHVLI